MAEDAARAVRVPGPRGDRHVPTRPRGQPRPATAAAYARERPASLRVLSAEFANRHRAAVRIVRPHSPGRTDLRHNMVRRQQPFPALRTAADAARGKTGCAARCYRATG